MTDYKRYVILLGFDNTIKSSKEVFPFLMSGTDLNNALRHFLDLECGIPFHKTDNLTTYYRSIILAGPSTKGQELAAKVNAGQKLTWDDLNGATWAVMGASSASGYIYPSLQ